jgi:hypothetical protein
MDGGCARIDVAVLPRDLKQLGHRIRIALAACRERVDDGTPLDRGGIVRRLGAAYVTG